MLPHTYVLDTQPLDFFLQSQVKTYHRNPLEGVEKKPLLQLFLHSNLRQQVHQGQDIMHLLLCNHHYYHQLYLEDLPQQHDFHPCNQKKNFISTEYTFQIHHNNFQKDFQLKILLYKIN